MYVLGYGTYSVCKYDSSVSGHARRAAPSRAASGCATGAARRAPMSTARTNLAEPRIFGGIYDKRRIERRKRAWGWSIHPSRVPAGDCGASRWNLCLFRAKSASQKHSTAHNN